MTGENSITARPPARRGEADNDADQTRLIPEFLAGIAHLLRRAEELKIREKRVVVVQSEMGRRPDYNKGSGKDHLVRRFGHVPRPRHPGRPRHRGDRREAVPRPLDPSTLARDEQAGIRVRPEHVHLALRQFAGITDHPLTRKFPLGVPEEERLRGLWR